MFGRFWNNKENIFYTVVTVFLLERVRRGINKIEARGKASNLTPAEVERKQETFVFGAALLYALPFLLPAVKYIYRSIAELSGLIPGLAVLNNVWVFAVILLATEAVLAIIVYNLLGIYVERMNGALGFFKKLGRSVLDGSKVAVYSVSVTPVTKVTAGVRGIGGVCAASFRRTRSFSTAGAAVLSNTVETMASRGRSTLVAALGKVRTARSKLLARKTSAVGSTRI